MGEVCWSSHWGWRRREVNVRANNTCGVPPSTVTGVTLAQVRRVTEETINTLPNMPPWGARGSVCEALWNPFAVFDGRRMSVVRTVGASAPARTMRIRHEVHDQTNRALLDNPLWVRRCASRNRHVKTDKEHVENERNVVVVVVAI